MDTRLQVIDIDTHKEERLLATFDQVKPLAMGVARETADNRRSVVSKQVRTLLKLERFHALQCALAPVRMSEDILIAR